MRYREADIAPYRAETPADEHKTLLSQRGQAVKEDLSNPQVQLWLDPSKLAWYLTSAENISLFMQARTRFIRHVEIKAGGPNGNHDSPATRAVSNFNLNKILEEKIIYNRNYKKLESNSRNIQEARSNSSINTFEL